MIPACQLLEPVLAIYLRGDFLVVVLAGPAPAILARAPHVALVPHNASDVNRFPGFLCCGAEEGGDQRLEGDPRQEGQLL